MNDTNANTTTNGGGNSNSANNNNNNNNEYQYADFDPNAITASLFEEEEGRDDDNVDDLVEVGRNTNTNGGGGGGGSDDNDNDNDNVMMMSRFATTDNSNHNMEAIDEEQTTEFDHPRHQGVMMAMMEEYSDDNDGVGVGGDNDRDDDVINVNGNTNNDDDDDNRENYDANTTTSTTTMMDTTDSNKVTSSSSSSCQTSVDGVGGDRRPFQRRRNGNLQIDTSSSNEQHPSWLSAVKDIANNSSSNDDENGGEEQEQRGEKGLEPSNQNQQEQASSSSSSSSSSETTDLIQDISEKLDDKLNNTRLLAKKLLQEITVYVQSLEQVENKYSRIVELESNESLRLDVVEPEVQGASGMLLSTGAPGGGNGNVSEIPLGHNGSFFPITTTTSHAHRGVGGAQQQQQPPLPTAAIGRRYSSSSPKSSRTPMRPQRGENHSSRPLTPFANHPRTNGGNGNGNGGGMLRFGQS